MSSKRPQTSEICADNDLGKYRAEIPHTVIRGRRRGKLSLSARWLYVYFVSVCSPSQEKICTRSTKTIAQEAGLAAGVIGKAKQELVDATLIMIEAGDRARHIADRIRLVDIWGENMREFASSSPDVPDSDHPSSLDEREKNTTSSLDERVEDIEKIANNSIRVHQMNASSSPDERETLPSSPDERETQNPSSPDEQRIEYKIKIPDPDPDPDPDPPPIPDLSPDQDLLADGDCRAHATPIKTPKKPRKTKVSHGVATPLPSDFALTDKMHAWGEKTCPEIDLVLTTDQWLDAMRSHDYRYLDWESAWRNGIRFAINKGIAVLKPQPKTWDQMTIPEKTAFLAQQKEGSTDGQSDQRPDVNPARRLLPASRRAHQQGAGTAQARHRTAAPPRSLGLRARLSPLRHHAQYRPDLGAADGDG